MASFEGKNIISVYSNTHEYIYNEYFLKSYNKFLSKDFKLCATKIDQISKSGNYGTQEFNLMTLEKLRWIIKNIDVSNKNLLVFSDCDIQFFNLLNFNIADKDIMFQDDYYGYCTGFFICKQSNKVLSFFKEVENYMTQMNMKVNDQEATNNVLKYYQDVLVGYLPRNKYWTIANFLNGKIWIGQSFDCPKDIIMHHANFTIGIENKVKLLESVRNKMYEE
jgi:hypothetical protein